jgi:lysophospholipase L1-like esterase
MTSSSGPLNETARFAIDFNLHEVATALGLPIPASAAAAIYGVAPEAIAAYQAEIDADLTAAAQAVHGHAGLDVLAGLAGVNGRVLCIGDSITTYRYSYARILRGALAARGISLVNHAYSGYTTTHALELTYTRFLAERPTLVLVKYGVNDCKQFGGPGARTLVSPDEYADNLRRVIRAFQSHAGARVIVLTPTLVVEDMVNANPDIAAMRLTWTNANLHERGGLALAAAAETGAHGIDLREVLGQPPNLVLFCADGLHPNPAGQRALLAHLLDTFATFSRD